jgi:cytidylate kinase
MYRAVALKALQSGIDPAEADAVAALTRGARIAFEPDGNAEEGEVRQRVLLDGEDVTAEIRKPEVSQLASVVSAIPGVRSALVAQQQAMGVQGGVVMEGRDIGTVVFPNAELKVYLTASPEERAVRRLKELETRGMDVNASLERVRAEQDERDARDATRPVSPLVAAPDAVQVESDGLTPAQVVDDILALVDARRREA